MKARNHGTADSMDQVMLEITLDRYGQEKCREDVQRDARRPRLLVSCSSRAQWRSKGLSGTTALYGHMSETH